MKVELDSVETRLLDHTDRVRMELLERMEKVETTLLKEFRKWAISFESRFRANDAVVVGFNERLISVEERLSDLEQIAFERIEGVRPINSQCTAKLQAGPFKSHYRYKTENG